MMMSELPVPFELSAEIVASMARRYDEQGKRRLAFAAQTRAERLYEQAGLDPAWHDLRSVSVSTAAMCRPLKVQEESANRIGLGVDDMPGLIFCNKDDLVEVER